MHANTKHVISEPMFVKRLQQTNKEENIFQINQWLDKIKIQKKFHNLTADGS